MLPPLLRSSSELVEAGKSVSVCDDWHGQDVMARNAEAMEAFVVSSRDGRISLKERLW